MSSNSECFGCGRPGHWVKHCPNASGTRGRGRGRGRELFNLFCYRCGDQGHMARDCDQTEDGVHLF
uniref:CCHC-type domain-containing protein n=1 Tax=Oryzias melastigma TaxID=30732 RepID=A0A3B3BNP7_ORYME